MILILRWSKGRILLIPKIVLQSWQSAVFQMQGLMCVHAPWMRGWKPQHLHWAWWPGGRLPQWCSLCPPPSLECTIQLMNIHTPNYFTTQAEPYTQKWKRAKKTCLKFDIALRLMMINTWKVLLVLLTSRPNSDRDWTQAGFQILSCIALNQTKLHGNT